MGIETAEDLFIEELQDIYSAEKQAVRAYPRLVKSVESDELKQALQTHLEETKEQVSRLERAFELLEAKPGRKTCEGMKGLLEEAAQHAQEIEPGPLLDAALIGALQRVEHYEIAAYGTVATLAEAMGQKEVQALLGETLDEEKETDVKLTEVSQGVNSEALANAEEQDDEEEEEGSDDQATKGTAKQTSAKSSNGRKTSSKRASGRKSGR
jgi:ferritin-like metal-binding protein YciE